MKTEGDKYAALPAAIGELIRRKKVSRDYLRSLSPDEKVRRLATLQEQYYLFLAAREERGGKPVPEKWRKWYQARQAYSARAHKKED